jgi:hypothetical protein|tara:strand:- start:220 stop:711 length:492 start_codon:yes stop_codon:yes gene_type:complete
MKTNIIDNFLSEEDFTLIKNQMVGGDYFPWYFQNTVSSERDKNYNHFFWTHIFFDHRGIASKYYAILNPIFKKLAAKALMRVKGNMYSNQGKLQQHQKHRDYPFKHKGALFSLNTCDGFTAFSANNKIKSVANRMIFFDPSNPHYSSTCTDANIRVNIVFNYF